MKICKLSKEEIPGLNEPVLIARLFEREQLTLVDIFTLTDPSKIDWLLTIPTEEEVRAARLFDREDRMNYFIRNYYRYVKS